MATQKVPIPTWESHLVSNGNHGKLFIVFLVLFGFEPKIVDDK